METTDSTLLAACRSGNADAWETLVRRYAPLIYAIPRRAGLGEDLANDVFQHVFVRLFEKLDTIEQPDRLRSWLVTTARRESWRLTAGERKTTSLTQSGSDGETTWDMPDDAPLPEETLLRLEQRQQVRDAMATLDERCRTLLTLLFVRTDTPPYTEIAATLKISEGSIGPTRSRCLGKLRQRLDDVGL